MTVKWYFVQLKQFEIAIINYFQYSVFLDWHKIVNYILFYIHTIQLLSLLFCYWFWLNGKNVHGNVHFLFSVYVSINLYL